MDRIKMLVRVPVIDKLTDTGADPEPQDRVCTGDINEIAININTKSAYRIASDTSPFLVRVVVRDGWKRRLE